MMEIDGQEYVGESIYPELDQYTAKAAIENAKFAEALSSGTRLGMNMAIDMIRDGRIRLWRAPWEKKEWPRKDRIRPIKATTMIWRAWWKELHA